MKKIFLIILTCVGVSCSVEQLPRYELVDGNAIIDQRTALAALNGAYSNFTTDEAESDGYFHFYYDSGFLLINGHLSGLLSGYSSFNFLGDCDEFTFEDNYYSTAGAIDKYTQYNAAIANGANTVLHFVPDLDDSLFEPEVKNEIIGQAYILRAFAWLHFFKLYGYVHDINSKYGGIYKKEMSMVSNTQCKRETVRDTYKFLLEDLDTAIEMNIPFKSVYRMSSLYAKVLKAEVLLMRGEGDDIRNVLTLCTEILSSSERKLEIKHLDVYINQYDSPELIFTRSISDDVIESGLDGGAGKTIYKNFGPYSSSTPPNASALYKEVAELDNRLSNMQINVSIEENGDPRTCFLSCTDIHDGDVPVYFARVAQVHLMKAEALFRTGASYDAVFDCLDVLNLRAGNDPIIRGLYQTNETLEKLIFDEIIRELNFENSYLWTAYKRFKINGINAIEVYRNDPDKDDLDNRPLDYVVLPIPRKEMDNNALMIQNPAYSHLK